MLTARIMTSAVLLASLAWLPASAQSERGPRPEIELADQLVSAARTAAASQPGTQAAQWRVQAAGHDLAAAGSRRLPRPSMVLTSSQGATSSDLRLTQTLHDWGSTQARIDSATAQLSAAEQGVHEFSRGVALDVIEVWRTWASACTRARALGAHQARLAQYERGARRRGEVGFSSDADLALVMARVVQARSDEASALASLSAAAARLRGMGVVQPLPGAVDLCTLSGNSDEVADASIPIQPNALRLAELVSRAQLRSPTLRRLRAEVEVAEALARAARADRLPLVSAVTSHQRTDGSSRAGASTRLLLALEYAPPTWGGGGDTARAATSRASAARAELDAASQAITRSLESEHELLIGLCNRWQSERSALASTSAVLTSFERQFPTGRKNWLDVLNAARELAGAEIAARTLLVDLTASWARLAVLADYGSAAEAAL